VIGQLYYDLADKEDDYACKPLTGIHIQPSTRLDRTPIIMVDRGNCTFVSKVRNVQNLGGGLALIVDNMEESLDSVLLNNEGTGSDIYIPAVMISKKDGDKIKEFLMANKEDKTLLSNVILALEFKMVKF
jgi:hypothetical protein